MTRPTADFHANIWGDHFHKYTHDEAKHDQMKQQINELKDLTRKEVLETRTSPLKQLKVIDQLQRLGVAYHFKNEIDQALKEIYQSYCDHVDIAKDDLYHTSLRFRLLREHGFNISSDIFKIFMDSNGSFNGSLTCDVLGLLNLYEASHLRAHADGILDEALEFSRACLTKSAVTDGSSNPNLAAQVTRALKHPLHRGMPRLESRHYISFYEKDPCHNPQLLEFAKLDFNFLQSLHKKELKDMARWWGDLEFATGLSFLRDRIAEAYFWALGVYYEPQRYLVRKIFCKVAKMVSSFDDLYDAYGTYEELEIMTRAVERWDSGCMDELPDYMKVCYQTLLDTFKGFEQDLAEEGRSSHVYYLREKMKSICRTFLLEARWRQKKHMPTYDEYMNEVAITGFGQEVGIVGCFLGMGHLADMASFEWAHQNPKVVRSAGVIGRLLNDTQSHKFEQGREHIPSAMECYMNEYGLTDEKEAYIVLQKHDEDAWKDLNEAMLQPTAVPMPLIQCILNLCRAEAVIYKSEDGYTFSNNTMKDNIAMLLVDPIPV